MIEFLDEWGAVAAAIGSALAAAISAATAWRAHRAMEREASKRQLQDRKALWRELMTWAARLEYQSSTLERLAGEAIKVSARDASAEGTLRASGTSHREQELKSLQAQFIETGQNARGVANAHPDFRTMDMDAATNDCLRLEQSHIRLQYPAERLDEFRAEFQERYRERRARANQPRPERKSGYEQP